MDYETGEGVPDKETGELPLTPSINSETGEYEYYYMTRATTEKSKGFKIPRDLINQKTRKETISVRAQERRLVFGIAKLNTPIFLFVVPTIILLIPTFLIALLAVELVLHSWAHRKNDFLKKEGIDSIYYESPYHIVAREFCPLCRMEAISDKITRIQDKRTRRLFIKYGLDYVKRVV